MKLKERFYKKKLLSAKDIRMCEKRKFVYVEYSQFYGFDALPKDFMAAF